MPVGRGRNPETTQLQQTIPRRTVCIAAILRNNLEQSERVTMTKARHNRQQIEEDDYVCVSKENAAILDDNH